MNKPTMRENVVDLEMTYPAKLERALADLEASKTASRRAREEVGDITLLLLQARAENKSLQRTLERSQGELRELNSALVHFEESHREEVQGTLDSNTRKLTRAKLERALAEEQEAHRATRRQLELVKLAAAEDRDKLLHAQNQNTKTGNSSGGRNTGRENNRGSRGFFGRKDKHDRDRDNNDQDGDGFGYEGEGGELGDEIPLSLEERREEMERSSNEYRKIILMLSEEIESLKSQLSAMTQAFEDHIPLDKLITLATSSQQSTDTQPKVRLIAARTIVNLAAREERRPDIVGSLPDLLNVLHGRGQLNETNMGGTSTTTSPNNDSGRSHPHHPLESENDSVQTRLICAAVANLSIDSKYQGEVVKLGGIDALNQLSEKAGDSQTLRMCAGALANLCANALLKDELIGKGVVQTLVSLQERVQHPDVEAQVARGLANWVVSSDPSLGIGKILEEFTTSGGLSTLLKLGENREADLVVKKQVGTAIYHTFKSFPQMTKEQIVNSPNGLKPLLEMKKCADREVSELAESSLKLFHNTTLL